MLFQASPDIRDCVAPEKLEQFDKEKEKIYVDPNSLQTQAGKLKQEGFFQSGFFKSPKCYVLNPFFELEERIVKSKGLAREIREKIPDKSFKIKRKADTELFYQHYSLHPSISECVYISLKRKKMSNAINCKRIMTEVI